ncbi:MAG: hypothetical protein A2297_01320 [Elusimicrobia bacterium RIFOXYB2_FULL_48_7]|nr:MAG: hypothetical protein A2297_01320 [Elusimicrobia bacterium RIFOXYB2_FULL_48_7]
MGYFGFLTGKSRNKANRKFGFYSYPGSLNKKRHFFKCLFFISPKKHNQPSDFTDFRKMFMAPV